MDYAGDTLEWVDLRSGELHEVYVFVAALGFSQLLFAWAAEDMKSRNWLASHRRMYAYYGGVPHVTVPDCLKQGVLKCHLYDPDLNPGYAQLATHYATAIVPARPAHPKDKAICEGNVRILMRYFRFRHRRRTFTSLAEINRALAECVEQINERKHSRFGVSRAVRASSRWRRRHSRRCRRWTSKRRTGKRRRCTPIATCTSRRCITAPRISIATERLRVKLTENRVEIFRALERIASHPRSRHRDGGASASRRTSPPIPRPTTRLRRRSSCRSRASSIRSCDQLFIELFNADVYGNLRRAQGLVRSATKEINTSGHELASQHVAAAIAAMRCYDKIRVPYFQALLAQRSRSDICRNR